jgi:hypothetical protein
MGVAAAGGGDRGGEEVLHLEDAALVAMYLLEVTRDTVDSCMPIASATVLRLSGRRCCDAIGEEAVLLADDLGGDLEDGAGALVEALHQPVGGLQAVGSGRPVLRPAAAAVDLRVVDLVDQHPRQRVGVELDQPAAVRRRGRTKTSGTTVCTAASPKAWPGLGLSRAELGEHLGEILVVDAAERISAEWSRRATRSRWATSACIAGS